MGYPHHTLKNSITYTQIYISTHCILFMTYILVQEHVTSTTRGEKQKFATLDTSGCLMADVPHLNHLKDSQKEHHNNEKVIWCIGLSISCIACFYKPYDCLATLGSPIGALVGLLKRQQTILHMGVSPMCDWVAFNGRNAHLRQLTYG